MWKAPRPQARCTAPNNVPSTVPRAKRRTPKAAKARRRTVAPDSASHSTHAHHHARTHRRKHRHSDTQTSPPAPRALRTGAALRAATSRAQRNSPRLARRLGEPFDGSTSLVEVGVDRQSHDEAIGRPADRPSLPLMDLTIDADRTTLVVDHHEHDTHRGRRTLRLRSEARRMSRTSRPRNDESPLGLRTAPPPSAPERPRRRAKKLITASMSR